MESTSKQDAAIALILRVTTLIQNWEPDEGFEVLNVALDHREEVQASLLSLKREFEGRVHY